MSDVFREEDEIGERYRRWKSRLGISNSTAGGIFDKIDPETVGRILVALVCQSARWEWNKRATHQAFGDLVPGLQRSAENMIPRQPKEAVKHVRNADVVVAEFEKYKEMEKKKAKGEAIAPEEEPSLPVGAMFTRSNNEKTVAYCGLFAVLKVFPLLRLVFDGRPGNAHFDKTQAKPFRLFTLKELMEALDMFIWEEECHFITGDLRHFYYQLRMCQFYAAYFAIKLGDLTWYPLVMCMGFFAVCYWAQATTITMLLHQSDLDPSLGVCEAEVAEGMPPIIWLYKVEGGSRKRRGFIAVIMDGFLLVTTDRELKSKWMTRIVKNMKYFNAELKEVKQPFDWKLFEKYPQKLPAGLCKKFEKQRRSTTQKEEKNGETRPEKAAKPDSVKNTLDVSQVGAIFNGMIIVKGHGWTTEADIDPLPPTRTATRKEWAHTMGELLWAIRVSKTPLIEKLDMMQIYPALHDVPGADWDDEVTLSEEHYQVLSNEIEIFSKHLWTSRPAPFDSRVFYGLLSDAHPTGKGRVLLKWDDAKAAWRPVMEISERVEKGSQMEQEMSSVVDGIEETLS